ncbi:MAG: hypothetical protein ACI9XO_003027 [Paraglaciecola sp.]|jgi:hypothetical protein
MNILKLSYCLFALMLIFQSCQLTTSKPLKEMEKPFFDLKSYFEQEKTRLAALSNFTKTTMVDGKEETKKIEKLNFDNELRIFTEADINKPAWFDKYAIDSVLQAGNLTKISYTATDKKRDIQNIVIDFSKQKVIKINIKKSAETALADTQFQLIYEPKIGYSIENTQQLTVGEDKKFLVTVQF